MVSEGVLPGRVVGQPPCCTLHGSLPRLHEPSQHSGARAMCALLPALLPRRFAEEHHKLALALGGRVRQRAIPLQCGAGGGDQAQQQQARRQQKQQQQARKGLAGGQRQVQHSDPRQQRAQQAAAER